VPNDVGRVTATAQVAIERQMMHTIWSVRSEPGPIERFMAADHAHLDAMLAAAAQPDGAIDSSVFERFRAGLLRHIAMEEKILLPDAKRRRGGEPLPVFERLHADHGLWATLLVPTPTAEIVAAIGRLLASHNPLEEGQAGAYSSCDELCTTDADALIARLREAREPPLAPHFDGPLAQKKVAETLAAVDRRCGKPDPGSG
jgi:hypothetical protein